MLVVPNHVPVFTSPLFDTPLSDLGAEMVLLLGHTKVCVSIIGESVTIMCALITNHITALMSVS